jgi:hypothetical protein
MCLLTPLHMPTQVSDNIIIYIYFLTRFHWIIQNFKNNHNSKIFALLGCYVVYIGSYLPMFGDNLLVLNSRVKQGNKNARKYVVI